MKRTDYNWWTEQVSIANHLFYSSECFTADLRGYPSSRPVKRESYLLELMMLIRFPVTRYRETLEWNGVDSCWQSSTFEIPALRVRKLSLDKENLAPSPGPDNTVLVICSTSSPGIGRINPAVTLADSVKLYSEVIQGQRYISLITAVKDMINL